MLLSNHLKMEELSMENEDSEDFLFEIVDPFPPDYVPMPEMVLFSSKKRELETES